MTIKPLIETHWPLVRTIYEQGMATGNATFETQAPAWEKWNQGHLLHSRLVALDEQGVVQGWAALSPVSGRCVYGGVAELSIYIATEARGQGVGRQLLAALIQESEAHGIWTLQAGTFEENAASIGLHRQAGFRLIGHRERIGQHCGVWRNTVQMERRSLIIGI